MRCTVRQPLFLIVMHGWWWWWAGGLAGRPEVVVGWRVGAGAVAYYDTVEQRFMLFFIKLSNRVRVYLTGSPDFKKARRVFDSSIAQDLLRS